MIGGGFSTLIDSVRESLDDVLAQLLGGQHFYSDLHLKQKHAKGPLQQLRAATADIPGRRSTAASSFYSSPSSTTTSSRSAVTADTTTSSTTLETARSSSMGKKIAERLIPLKISGFCGFGDSCTADVCDERMRLAKKAAESEFDDTGASDLSASAEKRAIHEAWVHARKAQDAAKEAADAAMQSVEEAARVQKFLDPHDVLKVEDQTEMDVKKESLAAGTVAE
ncbi:unnamed protein product [Amoebophrya sp. A120]|nr:unnamed protein product [Amoebophrya sp. A120]|eukprot:GSA120T00022124001.1